MSWFDWIRSRRNPGSETHDLSHPLRLSPAERSANTVEETTDEFSRITKFGETGASAPPVSIPELIEVQTKILDYVRRLSNGQAPDPEFEKRSLNHDLRFNSLGLAELFFVWSNECGVPVERTAHFLRVGIQGGDDKIGILLERIIILARGFSQERRMKLLDSGVVGDRKEIGQFNPSLDSVGVVVGMCEIIRNELSQLKGHDAIEMKSDTVIQDPGWE